MPLSLEADLCVLNCERATIAALALFKGVLLPNLFAKTFFMPANSKTVKGGKKMSFRAIVVVGNEKGQVGVGVGKAGDVIGAVRKGVSDGKKNLVRVPLTPNNSIPTLSIGRDGAANVLIRPAAPGTGVIAGGSIRTVLELAGIKNVLAKRLGSKTPLNNARAAMVALSQLRTHKSASRERGISLEQLYS